MMLCHFRTKTDILCVLLVIMKPQEEAPPNMHCKDMFLVQSVVVREATTTNDLTEEMVLLIPMSLCWWSIFVLLQHY
jgi:hypothetical protein